MFFEKLTRRQGIFTTIFLLPVLISCLVGCRATSNKISPFSTPPTTQTQTQIAPQAPAQNPNSTNATNTITPVTPIAANTNLTPNLTANTTNLTSASTPFFSGTASISNSNSNTNSTTQPNQITRESLNLDPNRYEAFRPIIPSHIAEPAPINKNEINKNIILPNANPLNHANSNTTTENLTKNSEDEKNELKKQIAILEAELKKAKETTQIINNTKEQQTPEKNNNTLENNPIPENNSTNEIKLSPAPVFNVDGVTTIKDEKGNVRIIAVDTALFMGTSWKLTTKAEELLRRITTEIKAAYPDAEIDVEGHTDNLDVDPKNPTQKHDISAIKAGVVMDYCVKILKYNPTKMKTISCGSKRPIADNATAEGRAKNNRIEIVILTPKN
jgi:flagellar motor protein MotB